IKAWGVENIAISIAATNESIAACLEQIGCTLPAPAQRCPHILGAKLPQGFKGNLVNELKEQHIYISQRGDSLRFAPHLHITEHDVERLTAALRELVVPR